MGQGQCLKTTGNTLRALRVPFPEADHPLATTTQRRILELGPSADKDAEDLLQHLSALAARNGGRTRLARPRWAPRP